MSTVEQVRDVTFLSVGRSPWMVWERYDDVMAAFRSAEPNGLIELHPVQEDGGADVLAVRIGSVDMIAPRVRPFHLNDAPRPDSLP